MHHIPRFLTKKKNSGTMESSKRKPRQPRLERRNALKNVDYDASSLSSLSSSSSGLHPLVTQSLDLDRKSFRVEGLDGEFDRICRSLGLSGPDDFTIPQAAWEAMKVRSSSDILPRSQLNRMESADELEVNDGLHNNDVSELELFNNNVSSSSREVTVPVVEPHRTVIEDVHDDGDCCVGLRGGIKGSRPSNLAPPPSMSVKRVDDMEYSTWELVGSFAPAGDEGAFSRRYISSSDEDEGVEEDDSDDDDNDDEEEVKEDRGGQGHVNVEEEVGRMMIRETGRLSESCSFTTNDDDASSTTTDPCSSISPSGRFRRIISSWQKGDLLGRGSYGSVYEGIAGDGSFIAVKEVSLIDQGSQAKQSILQLEQEIALLSQFEHQNIVQYYGTDKDESNLYIFLELVTKGSLYSLYQKYRLEDSQVSAYTRQILHGLKYLHDQNVVHRDIKCANILVDASGSVKLADFGLAKATTLNDVKSCKGTAFWMAPEVVNRRNLGYGLAADIWSLGCTVLEMVTRQLPYAGLDGMQALFRIGNKIPPDVPDTVSKDAQDFIKLCLQVNPSDRPTAVQLLEHPFVMKPLPQPLQTSSGFPASPQHFVRRL